MRTILLATVATLTIAACGSTATPTSSSASGSSASTSSASPSPPASTAITHVCSIFPIADAQRLTGIALQPGVDAADECTYDRADSTEHLAVVTVNLAQGPSEPHQYEFDASHPIGADTLHPLTGIGDKAFYGDALNMIVAIKGNNLIHVFPVDSTLTNRQALDTAIALLVFSHLS